MTGILMKNKFWFLLIGSLFLFPILVNAQATFVQGMQNYGTGTGVSVTVGAVSAGDTMLVTCSSLSGAINSVTDNNSDTYILDNSVVAQDSGQNLKEYRLSNTPGMSLTITCNTAATTFSSIMADEFSGIVLSNPVDNFSSNAATGTTASPGGAVTSGTNDLVYSSVAQEQLGAVTITGNNGFIRINQNSGAGTISAADLYNATNTPGTIVGSSNGWGGTNGWENQQVAYLTVGSSTPSASSTLSSSTYFDWSGIAFVKTDETVKIGSSTITLEYDPFKVFWIFMVILGSIIWGIYKISCMISE